MSVPMSPGDPAYWMLQDGYTSKPKVYRDSCYICRDPEFAQMGLPLCKPCPRCMGRETSTGHVPADDEECDDCGYNLREHYEREQREQEARERAAANGERLPFLQRRPL
jgi:hypothetical protein